MTQLTVKKQKQKNIRQLQLNFLTFILVILFTFFDNELKHVYGTSWCPGGNSTEMSQFRKSETEI